VEAVSAALGSLSAARAVVLQFEVDADSVVVGRVAAWIHGASVVWSIDVNVAQSHGHSRCRVKDVVCGTDRLGGLSV
jgi:hypothetical protein